MFEYEKEKEKVTKAIEFQLSKTDAKRLDKLVSKKYTSRSQLVRRIVLEALKIEGV